MKKLVFTALVCGGLLQMGTGCIITTSSSSDDGEFDVVWILESADENRNPIVDVICPSEYEVQFVAEALDAGNPDYDVLFNCDAGGGLSGAISPGEYDTFVNVVDRSGDLVAESDIARVIVPSDTVVEIDFQFMLDQSTFGLAWELVDAATMTQTIECNPGESVTSVSTLSANELPFEDIYNCQDQAGTTGLLPVGEYTIAMQLLDPQDQPVDGATAVINSAPLLVGNRPIDLDPVGIPVP